MAKAKKQDEPAGFQVISPFRDKDNFEKLYSIGEDVSHFDEQRIADCIEKGLVKKND